MEPKPFNIHIPESAKGPTENDRAEAAVRHLMTQVEDLPASRVTRDFIIGPKNQEMEPGTLAHQGKDIVARVTQGIPPKESLAQPKFDIDALIAKPKERSATEHSVGNKEKFTSPVVPNIKKVLRPDYTQPVLAPNQDTIEESTDFAKTRPADFVETSPLDFLETLPGGHPDTTPQKQGEWSQTQPSEKIIEVLSPTPRKQPARPVSKTFFESVAGWFKKKPTPQESTSAQLERSEAKELENIEASLRAVRVTTETLRANKERGLLPSAKRLLALLDESSLKFRKNIGKGTKVFFCAGLIATGGLAVTKSPLNFIFEKLAPSQENAKVVKQSAITTAVLDSLKETKKSPTRLVNMPQKGIATQPMIIPAKNESTPELLHTVKPSENLWSILRSTLTRNDYIGYENFASLSDAKKEEKIRSIVTEIEKDPKAYGFPTEKTNLIRPGNTLNLTKLLKK